VKKKKDNYWRRLLDEKSDIPTNMRVWFEMKEKYQDQIAKYEIDENDENVQNILETIEREEKKKERKSNKTKNKKKKKNKKKNKSTESDL
jgi:lipid II:glycine glycyltransferase (peptidoglycan interpeptide bridge formation enzyme)